MVIKTNQTTLTNVGTRRILNFTLTRIQRDNISVIAATVISNGDNSFDAEKDGHRSSTSVSVVRGGMAFGVS